jgi:hypothetical protein
MIHQLFFSLQVVLSRRFALLGVVTVATALTPTYASDALFTELLRSHVSSGAVNYTALKADPRLDAVIAYYSSVDHAKLSGNARMAFFINAYNAVTLKVVCDNLPVKSIRDIGTSPSKPATDVWDRPLANLKGQAMSLNDIEHKILRPMADPRIHFALVCAAKSCPPLRNEAYRPERLNEQLDSQARTFLTNTLWNRFDEAAKTAKLSMIFSWFAADFAPTTADVLKGLATYLPQPLQRSVQRNAAAYTVDYLEYDWSLNTTP